MKYDKDLLTAVATERIKGWADYTAALEAKKKADKAKELAEWQRKHKADVIEALQQALRNIKADKRTGLRLNRYGDEVLNEPPEPYRAPGHVCDTNVSKLEDLLAFLGTIDGEVTSSALDRAGVKDLHRVLRQPC